MKIYRMNQISDHQKNLKMLIDYYEKSYVFLFNSTFTFRHAKQVYSHENVIYVYGGENVKLPWNFIALFIMNKNEITKVKKKQ